MSPTAQVCACGEYFEVNDDGELCLVPGSMGLRDVLYITQTGVSQFEKGDYPWLARIRVKVQAAGGGSGGADAAADEAISRPGAAGGGYSESLIEAADLGAVESVVVGAGGAGGTGNGSGSPGGNSSFGGLVIATGGDGGTANMPSGSNQNFSNGIAGPTANTGDYKIGGGAGAACIRLSGVLAMSGQGGDSQLGTGGFGRTTSGPGSSPRGFGGGAGGACSLDGEAQNGEAGGNGIVIIELYG